MKVLVAESQALSRRAIDLHLTRWGFDVVGAVDGRDAWRVLESDSAPRILVANVDLPGIDGVELCRRAREQGLYVYVVLTSPAGDPALLARGVEAGADDVACWPFSEQELELRLRAARRIVELRSGLFAANDALRTQALRDPLTKLWNRGAALDFLHRELALGQREGKPVCVVLADVDRFRYVNDGFGHEAGDRVLVEVARRAVDVLRTHDGVSRYGGGEFLLMLSACDALAGARVAERVRRAVAREPVNTAARAIRVTVSLGVCSTAEWPRADEDELVRSAEAALQRAKDGGRDCVRLAVPDDFQLRRVSSLAA